MGCAKSKPEVAPAERPVLDADEEERKQRFESAVLARREAADLSAPLQAHHFHGKDRLAALVLGPAAGRWKKSTAGADIRLLSARKLVKHIDGGGKMLIRQKLQAAGVDVFLDAATVPGLQID